MLQFWWLRMNETDFFLKRKTDLILANCVNIIRRAIIGSSKQTDGWLTKEWKIECHQLEIFRSTDCFLLQKARHWPSHEKKFIFSCFWSAGRFTRAEQVAARLSTFSRSFLSAKQRKRCWRRNHIRLLRSLDLSDVRRWEPTERTRQIAHFQEKCFTFSSDNKRFAENNEQLARVLTTVPIGPCISFHVSCLIGKCFCKQLLSHRIISEF